MLTQAIDVSDQIAKAAITFAFVAVLGGAAGTYWSRLQRRREMSLSAVANFYEAYGTWFATWKVWSAVHEGLLSRDLKSELLREAAAAEGQFEALLVKIATERRLSASEVRRLGRFREGYQQLRESIEDDKKLPFRVQYEADEVSAYVAFKALSVEFASLLVRQPHRVSTAWQNVEAIGRSLRRRIGSSGAHPTWTPSHAQKALVEVTSWRVSGGEKPKWWQDQGAQSASKAIESLEKLEL